MIHWTNSSFLPSYTLYIFIYYNSFLIYATFKDKINFSLWIVPLFNSFVQWVYFFILSGLLSHIKENIIFLVRSIVNFGGFSRDESASISFGSAQFFYNSNLSHSWIVPMMSLLKTDFKFITSILDLVSLYVLLFLWKSRRWPLKTVSEYDQEIPQSQPIPTWLKCWLGRKESKQTNQITITITLCRPTHGIVSTYQRTLTYTRYQVDN